VKKETGVMIVKDGKGWGVPYSDGHSTASGWVQLENATIYDPRFCLKPTDVTYRGSHYTEELKTGKVVNVVRVTTVTILP
jgi:hypothetical protein